MWLNNTSRILTHKQLLRKFDKTTCELPKFLIRLKNCKFRVKRYNIDSPQVNRMSLNNDYLYAFVDNSSRLVFRSPLIIIVIWRIKQ